MKIRSRFYCMFLFIFLFSHQSHAEKLFGFQMFAGHQKTYKTDGIFVDIIYPNGPADKIGLIPGDFITHINNNRIYNIEDFNKYNFYNPTIFQGHFSDGKITKYIYKADIDLSSMSNYLKQSFGYSCTNIENQKLSVYENFQKTADRFCFSVYVADNREGYFLLQNTSGNIDANVILYKYGNPNPFQGEVKIGESKRSGSASEAITFGRNSSGWYQIIAYQYAGEGSVRLTYSESTTSVTSSITTTARSNSNSLSSSSTPSICRNPTNFCRDFSLKTTICGFVGEAALGEASQRSLDADPGALGGAAAGAACTTMLSQLSEIDLTPGDLVAAAIGGAAGSSAVEDLSNGDIVSSLLKGVIAFGATAYSNYSCHEAIKARCN